MLENSPSTQLEATCGSLRYQALKVELNVAVALSLRSDESGAAGGEAGGETNE